jgi:hypothetical protein
VLCWHLLRAFATNTFKICTYLDNCSHLDDIVATTSDMRKYESEMKFLPKVIGNVGAAMESLEMGRKVLNRPLVLSKFAKGHGEKGCEPVYVIG